MKNTSAIAAIIPVHNGAGVIGPCLDGLAAAGFAPGDIVVVDDASSDGTADICRARGIAPIVLDANVGAAGARNIGAAHSDAEILFFVDADVVVATDARAVIAAFFAAHPDHAALFGAYDARPAAPGRVSRIRNMLHRHVHIEGAGPASTFWTGCGAVRAGDFAAQGGFDAGQRMMEDVEFGLRLHGAGRPIAIHPELQGTHLKHWSLGGMMRTDLFDRAIPWARLLAAPRHGSAPAALNVSRAGQLSVLCVSATLAGLVLMLAARGAGLWLVAASLGLLAVFNRRFLRRLLREQSAADAVFAVPVLWLHYLCGGLGFFWVRSGLDRLTGGGERTDVQPQGARK
ncbi:glycosyltransferase family 2 protein [Profundibacterium mesophilum]|uniref:Dolichol-phosphate mannosyltransferase n=1 Tax=Profundibacterium mesophilum KAUST100406-0324 TaxID=1037889 RepID=A0A921TCN9_9RHOB|nr:glycosyltransferase family 2 protein [Profundibacterium mesophilum]KAF0675898.1 dolichol-phosphate mannosyltransferase [Profundibacterium mesophilum KAUST100406-0324]